MQAFGCSRITTDVNPFQKDKIQIKTHHHESTKGGKEV
jgi:hypothetical protein